MVEVINATGRKFFRPFERDLKRFMERVLEMEGSNKHVVVVLAGDGRMMRLNERFLFKKGTTDVISFDYGDTAEIYVNVDYATRLGDFSFYTGYLALHGLLHVLGYDHKRKDMARQMEEKQEAYIGLWKYS